MEYIKKEDLKDGDVFVAQMAVNHFLNKEGTPFYLRLKTDNTIKYETLYKSGRFVYDNVRLATSEEKHWLNKCIKLDKFITFEEAMKTFIPEYYEYVHETGMNFTKNRIYKCLDPSNLEKVHNFIDDCNIPNGWSGLNHKYFKPSTKEAYDAQFIIKKPEFVLPEKWGIKFNNQWDILSKFKPFNLNFSGNANDNSFYKYDEEWDGDLDKWKKKGYPIITHKTVKAKMIWDMVGDAAWRSAEPGVVFIDRYNKLSNTWYFEKIIATNPCGEQGLGAWGVCNLGHLNLPNFIEDGKMNYELLAEHAAIATRFLDNVVDANHYFYEDNKKAQLNIRRTGLGTLGLADALIKMKIKYGSEESLRVIEKIYTTIRDSAYTTSALLAKDKGSFGGYVKEKYLQGEFIKKLPEKIRTLIAKNGMRNAILLTQAPTGTISLLAGVSSGIEPVYEFSYKRNDRTGEHIVNHPLYDEWIKNHAGEEIPDYFVSANDLTPEDHVKVQAKVQNLTDSSISKTVNAPNSHTVEDVKKLYQMAYELGCKGVTYFRDGSRKGVLSKVEEEKPSTQPQQIILDRPLRVEGATYRIPTPLGVSFITVNQDATGNPFEVFITIGKAGSEVAAMAEALGRMISTTLRFGNHLPAIERAREIVEQLRGIGGGRSVGFGPNKIRSLPDAVAKALSLHFGFGVENHVAAQKIHADSSEVHENLKAEPVGATMLAQVATESNLNFKFGDICPSCGASALVYEEGCAKCHVCGHSEC